VGFISLFVFHEPTKQYALQNPWMYITSLVVLFVALIALACCENLRRKAPANYILLLLFTLAQSFMLGVISATFLAEEVLLAVGITAIITFSLTIFAFQTKWDFTTMGKRKICRRFLVILNDHFRWNSFRRRHLTLGFRNIRNNLPRKDHDFDLCITRCSHLLLLLGLRHSNDDG
jgi:hypothetical protein